jgi:hypothetical protein
MEPEDVAASAIFIMLQHPRKRMSWSFRLVYRDSVGV